VQHISTIAHDVLFFTGIHHHDTCSKDEHNCCYGRHYHASARSYHNTSSNANYYGRSYHYTCGYDRHYYTNANSWSNANYYSPSNNHCSIHPDHHNT
jgi:hypothetical protein